MKKLWSSIIGTIIIVAQIAAPFSSAGAQASTDTASPITIYNMEAQESSEFGYVNYKYVDANGNEISTKNDSFDDYFYSPVLPTSYDSRTNNYITTPKSQGSTGCCWAFSVISALESDSIIKGIDNVNSADYSEAHFVWFNKNSLVNDANDTTSGDGSTNANAYFAGGNWQSATASLARWSGLAEESDYPFAPYDASSMGNYAESNRYDTGSGVVIKSSEVLLNAADVKEWIMDHGSVTATYYSSNLYYNTNTYAYYYGGVNTVGNHQITIVGWDDNYAISNFKSSCQPTKKGAWLCKNSWGEDWGLDGYFWMSYSDPVLQNFVGFSAQSTDGLYKNYSYNGAGYSSYISIGLPYMSIANVFEAEEYEKLTAVSTYTLNTDLDVTVKIYKNLPSNYTSPVKGTLAASWTTNIARSGYHTIEAPTEISLEPGEIFSVVITMESNSSSVVDAPAEIGDKFSSNAKESYILTNGWSDTLSSNIKNVCIQAFTECDHQAKTDTTPASCTEDGHSKTTCSQCGKVMSEEFFKAPGHNTVTTTTSATCTKDGCIKTSCTVCGEIISETVISKTGHKTETVTTPATCTQDGSVKTTCTVCGEVITETIIPKTGHKTKTTTTAADCDHNGHEKTVCTVCGEVISETVIPAKGHQYGEWSPYVKDSKTGRMVSTRYCEICGSKMTQSYISGRNVVTLDELLERIFDGIRSLFKR